MGKYLGKRYGDTRTDLILTDKAQKVYDVTDYCGIEYNHRLAYRKQKDPLLRWVISVSRIL